MTDSELFAPVLHYRPIPVMTDRDTCKVECGQRVPVKLVVYEPEEATCPDCLREIES